ncbi:hypothetical protein J7E73_09385 [Paenibacillus albidus]|uniref:hypothetical protein n=1 Tax=Paenibacillus albidus TaxID=2041023 RepID=UPI001BE874A6|nr:hypothetical protein [Paenibacillus albidus]MBT2289344.1 hypothetical protein [Paenibacillus albidus]
MIRVMARAQLNPGDTKGECYLRTGGEAARMIAEGRLMTAACFKWNHNVFLYYECMAEEHPPQALLPQAEDALVDWPGQA